MRLIIIRTKDNETLSQDHCDFLAPKGTIGRGADNTLVLPDASRAISRLQATVDIATTGEAFITSHKSTLPLLLNGNHLPYDNQHSLMEGDILTVGDYQLKVTFQSNTGLDTPLPKEDVSKITPVCHINDAIWDELEAEFPSSLPEIAPEINNDPTHPLFTPPSGSTTLKDPLAMSKETSLEDLYQQHDVPESLFAQEDVFSQPTIMKDTTPSVLQAPQDLSLSSSSSMEKKTATETVINATSPAETRHHCASEWSISSPLLDEYHDENDFSGVDDLFINNAVPLTPAPDNLAILASDETPWSKQRPQRQPNSVPSSDLNEMIDNPLFEQEHNLVHNVEGSLTDDEPFAFEETLFQITPEKKPVREKTADTLPTKQARMGIEPVEHQPLKTPKSTSQAQLNGELYEAFIAGLGLDDIPNRPDFSPEQLYQAGKLLSLFSQGAVALLSSRHLLKQGINAEMTMILEEGNNPFKLLPSGKTALMQLFSTPMPGFMEPESAVRDALIDLQAHQLGMIAGVRAIITALLQKFSPEELEKQAVEQGYLKSKKSFFRSRKTALWHVLETEHKKMVEAADNDFYTLFSHAFLPAYDLEVRQYRATQKSKES